MLFQIRLIAVFLLTSLCCISAVSFGQEDDPFGGRIIIEADPFGASDPAEFYSQMIKARSAKQAEIPDEQRLELAGVQPTFESVQEFFVRARSTPESVELAKKSISMLGADSFDIRERAMKELIHADSVPEDLLKVAAQNGDIEVSGRAEMIIGFRKSPQRVLLMKAIFRTISDKKIKGLASDLIKDESALLKSVSRTEFSNAIVTTVVKADQPLLEKQFAEVNDREKLTYLKALSEIDPDSKLQRRKKLIASASDPSVLNDLLQMLTADKDKASLDLAIRLLSSSDKQVQKRAYGFLCSVTGQKFEFDVETESKKKASIEAWENWIAKNRSEIKIELQGLPLRAGKILVVDYSGSNMIRQLDLDGNLLWEKKGNNHFASVGDAQGNLFLTTYVGNKLDVFNKDHEVEKSFGGLPGEVSGISILANGNYLISAGNSESSIIELDQEGKRIWSRELEGVPKHARETSAGTFIVSLFNTQKVIEIDRSGDVISEFDVELGPYSTSPMPNGNVLVTFREGGIAEYTWSGEQLKKYPTSGTTYHADALLGGDIIYGDKTGVYRINPEGKIVWSKKEYAGTIYVSVH